MRYKILAIILFFYFLTLLQSSFLNHFSILGIIPNLVLILLCLVGFFEKPHKYLGVFSALAAGFFLDVFSKSFFGISILSMVIVYFFIKELINILRDTVQKYSIFYFIPIFIISVILYDFLFALFSYFSIHSILLTFAGYALLVKIFYNLVFATIGFCLFKKYPALRL